MVIQSMSSKHAPSAYYVLGPVMGTEARKREGQCPCSGGGHSLVEGGTPDQVIVLRWGSTHTREGVMGL